LNTPEVIDDGSYGVAGSLETSDKEAVRPAVVTVTPTAQKAPGTKGVALFFVTSAEGISVELQLDDGSDKIDPRDPAQALALYIQHNTLELLPRAALWYMQVAKEHRKATIPAGNDALVQLAKPRSADPQIVDASGSVIIPGDGSGC
jgi:hypothetical protein